MTRRRKEKRRARGTGSVRLRPDTGRYQAAFVVGYDENGNPQRVRREFDTSDEAELWLAKLLVAESKGETLTSTDQTLKQRVDVWLDTLEARKLSEGTLHDYRSTIERYVLPYLGRMRLRDLRPDHVEMLLTSLHKAGKSAYIMEKAHRYLSMVLINAVERELIPRNVARNVRPPKPEKARHPRWSAGEALTVLTHCEAQDNPIARYVILGLVTGLRREELLGLRWRDVDLGAAKLRVRHTVTYPKGGPVMSDVPKTDAAYRTVYFEERGVKALLGQLEHVELARASARRWEEHDLVFPSSVGTPHSIRLLREGFQAIWEAAGVPRIRLYDLRSTHGSILADAGVNPKLIADRLGHEDAGFTMSVYVRTQEPEQREVAHSFMKAVSGLTVAISPSKHALGAPEGATDSKGDGEESASGAAIPPGVN